MLGKLIKHEWKSTWRVGCLMLILIALVTAMGCLAFRTPLWKSMSEDFSGSPNVTVLDILSFFTLMMYIILLVGVSFGTIIFMGMHFYKTMYTDQGYLLHTLPVTKNQILFGKILISGLWYLIVSIAIAASVFVLCAAVVSAALPKGITLTDLWREIYPRMGEIIDYFQEELGINVGWKWIFGRIIGLLSPFVTMITLFGAISLGQLFTKHRVLMAIVSYIGIRLIEGLVNSVINSVIVISHLTSDGYWRVLNSNSNVNFYVSLGMAALLYVASYLVVSRRLNME